MNRLAVSLITLSLGLVLGLVAALLGGLAPEQALSGTGAAVAALAGSGIVGGLVLLERGTPKGAARIAG